MGSGVVVHTLLPFFRANLLHLFHAVSLWSPKKLCEHPQHVRASCFWHSIQSKGSPHLHTLMRPSPILSSPCHCRKKCALEAGGVCGAQIKLSPCIKLGIIQLHCIKIHAYILAQAADSIHLPMYIIFTPAMSGACTRGIGNALPANAMSSNELVDAHTSMMLRWTESHT